MANNDLAYRAEGFFKLIWIVVSIILIILIAPMKAKDTALCNEDKKLSSRIDVTVDSIQDLETEQAVQKNVDEQFEKLLHDMGQDIRYLVRKEGGIPANGGSK